MSERKEVKMSWLDFETAIETLANKILWHKNIDISNIYGMPRGGLVVAVRLSHLLDIPLITNTVFSDDHTLYVDDIVDTGETLKHVYQNWKIASLYWNPKANFEPEFWALKKTGVKTWIVFPWERK